LAVKTNKKDNHSNLLISPSLSLALQEESVAEMEDVSEEVSVAELSEGEGSCSSVETTARNMEELEEEEEEDVHNNSTSDNNQQPLPYSKVAVAVTRNSIATICSNSTTTATMGGGGGVVEQRRSSSRPQRPFQQQSAINASSSSSTTKVSIDAEALLQQQQQHHVDHHHLGPDSQQQQKQTVVDNHGTASSRVGEDDTASPPAVAIKIPKAAEGPTSSQQQQQQQQQPIFDNHSPMSLPKFSNPENCMWTSTHAANSPSEDRSSSLVNVLLQPLPPNFDSETQLPTLEPDYTTLIRLSLWSVIDGHGGGCVATYASEVLLPHVAASVSRALGCAIVDRGVCTVNGQLRDANALDLDGLIKTSDRGSLGNPNSIHYRSPFERSDSEGEEDEVMLDHENGTAAASPPLPPVRRSPPLATDEEDNDPTSSSDNNNNKNSSDGDGISTSVARLQHAGLASPHQGSASVSSVKTSVKTAASEKHREALLGTHSPREVAAITRAITESFLAVDEGWINSIDPVATHQTSCQSNGRWNSGACALVVFTIQRLDWTDISGNEPDDRERIRGGLEKIRGHDTSQNRDAARRRMLDFAARAKSASSMSTVSSTSSLTTEEAVHASGLESEITETEGEDDDDKSNSRAGLGRRYPARKSPGSNANIPQESLISAPGGCSCHCYRAHDAILYAAHVGDCRAVMLGSAPPRTIKVRDSFADHPDTTDDESSHHSSDETECLSSSDHDADSSDDDEVMEVDKLSVGSNNSRKPPPSAAAGSGTPPSTPSLMTYMRRPVRRSRRRTMDDTGANAPFIALPPLEKESNYSCHASPMIELELADMERRERRKQRALTMTGNGAAAIATALGSNTNGGSQESGKDPSDCSTSSQESGDAMRLIHLPQVARPIDLTTDHSAYNPAEVTAVLRRCNNAPRAISAGVGGGIKRVAGSLAVTRALGDAYLKTPLLSFLPYKSHAPYITARPEVNCRPVSSTSDKVLILATDGVWERASGEDALRWVRNFYAERIAEAERRNNRRSKQGIESSAQTDLPTSVILSPHYYEIRLAPASSNGTTLMNCSGNSVVKGSLDLEQEQERQDDQNQKMDAQSLDHLGRSRSRKRGVEPRSPSPPSNKRRKRGGRRGNAVQCGWSRSSSVADVIVRRVLNKVRRARNISSLHALMSLPQGRARRSKHDDITACVVDLSAFVS
jgi:serine/threonine protein phosphatase PrpC